MEVLQTIWSYITRFFYSIRINYIVDIGIITFVIYKVLGFIKETRAEQLVKGFFVLFLIAKLSDWLKLYAISYVLQSTFTVGLIALVIIFQPELRKGLERIGRSQLFVMNNRKFFEEEYEVTVNEIVDAAGVMSRKKIGALIVIERMTGINDIAQTGTIIDAQISADLLMNIFYPKSPLHDGAVVVKNNRIMAAGCLLPLTTNQYISKELGTRHRAGMGMAESSDALIVIVSEETGAISLAFEGKLQRFLDTTTLKDLLLTHLSQEKELKTGGKKVGEK